MGISFFKFTAIQKLTIGLLAAAALLALTILFSYKTSRKLYSNFEWVDHTYKVSEQLETIILDLTENESAVRGFIITGDDHFITDFTKSTSDIYLNIKSLQTLTKDNESQQKRVLELFQLTQMRNRTFSISIKLKKSGGEESITRIVNSGKIYMDQIRTLKEVMEKEEELLLKMRQEEGFESLSNTKLTFSVTGIISLSILILCVLVVRQDIVRRMALEKELKELDKNKNTFFSIISHDLRGPIHGITKLTSLYEDPKKISPDQSIAMGQLIRRTSMQVSDLLENLLTWSKIQMGTLKMRPEIFNIQEATNESLKLLESSASSKGIIIENQLKPHWIYGDKNMINVVIRNLIHNSIKFTESGGKVLITSNNIDSNTVEIRIKDNGVGIQKEVLDKLFQLDHPTSSAGTDNEKGSGLGLILCKDFAEMNKGTIRIESEEGKGTECFLTFPINKV